MGREQAQNLHLPQSDRRIERVQQRVARLLGHLLDRTVVLAWGCLPLTSWRAFRPVG